MPRRFGGQSRVTTLPDIDVLVVCTGNICRSPMAEALLGRRLAERGVQARVHSTGVTAVGRPASASSVEVMADHGIDISEHRSSVLSTAELDQADLVLAMARSHVREAVVLSPEAFSRTFTIKELVRFGRKRGARADESVGEWLARMHVGRRPTDYLGSSRADDVDDPIGRRLAVYERTADELAELVNALVELMWSDETGQDPPTRQESSHGLAH